MSLGKVKQLIITILSSLRWEKKVPIFQMKEKSNLLSGTTALISGGSGGIGMAIAKKFLERGCEVVIAGTNETKLQKCALELGTPYYKVIDLEKVSSFDEAIKEIATMINGKLNILVNCSGVHTKRENFNFLSVTEYDYDYVMNINLKGTYFLSQAFARYMINNNIKGHILNISSQSALEASWSPYRLSKRGIDGITRGMAQVLLPYGIIVNSIGPGPTATSMQDECVKGSIFSFDNPINRYTLPEEVAEYACLMVSQLGDTIIGDTLYMSGGRAIIDGK